MKREYLNGKGKKYHIGKLAFEGEFLNGKKNGYGREYTYDSSLKYEGEFLNNKANGRGKEYNIEGNLMFDGEFSNGYFIEESKNDIIK